MHEDMMIDTADNERQEPTQRRSALVSQWLAKVKHAKKFHEKSFKQMRTDMDAVLNGYDEKNWSGDNYVANILQRHVQQRTAALYAKTPRQSPSGATVCRMRFGMVSLTHWLKPLWPLRHLLKTDCLCRQKPR